MNVNDESYAFMTDNTEERSLPAAVPLPRYGRVAFVSALIGAGVLLIAGIALIISDGQGASQVLAWLAIAGTVAMVGGIVVYIVAAALTIWRAERGTDGQSE